MNPPVPPKLLERRSITERFPGVLALSEVNFEVGQGEVVALVGENGAGKSTLMKTLSGVYVADGGEITFKGEPVHFTNPRQAQAAGIATIYQELNQVSQLSVAENIFLSSEIANKPVLSWPEMHCQDRWLLAKLRLDVDLDVPSNAKEIVVGIIIVLAVALDVIRRGEITWLRLPGMCSSKS